MSKKSSTLALWLAGINSVVSSYILWTFYKALQYVPDIATAPIEVTAIEFGVLIFEFIGLIISIGYFIDKKNTAMAKMVYGVSILQIIAVILTPFLVASVVMPRF